jgi:hypothetical protein
VHIRDLTRFRAVLPCDLVCDGLADAKTGLPTLVNTVPAAPWPKGWPDNRA